MNFFLAKNINVSVKLPFKKGVKKEKVFNTVCYNRLIVGYTVSTKLIGFSHHGVAGGNDCSNSGPLMSPELNWLEVGGGEDENIC